MKCPKCGRENNDDSKYCGYCGYLLNDDEKNNNDIKDIVMKNNNTGRNSGTNNVADETETVLNILSFLFPIVGIICYFVMLNTTPKKGKSALKFALISIVISMVLGFIFGIITVLTIPAINNSFPYPSI